MCIYIYVPSVFLQHLVAFRVELKGKVVRLHTMKAYRGIGGKYPVILNLRYRFRCMFDFKFQPSYTLEITPASIY